MTFYYTESQLSVLRDIYRGDFGDDESLTCDMVSSIETRWMTKNQIDGIITTGGVKFKNSTGAYKMLQWKLDHLLKQLINGLYCEIRDYDPVEQCYDSECTNCNYIINAIGDNETAIQILVVSDP